MKNSEKAVELFLQGYSCSQAVFGAFAKDLGIDESLAFKLSSPFGGGFGRLREVCGAVSGMLMVFGVLYGYDTPDNGEIKKEHYAKTRELCEKFKEQHLSIVCKDILKEKAQVGGTPDKRTEKFYQERPCVRCVRDAATIIEEYIREQSSLWNSI